MEFMVRWDELRAPYLLVIVYTEHRAHLTLFRNLFTALLTECHGVGQSTLFSKSRGANNCV